MPTDSQKPLHCPVPGRHRRPDEPPPPPPETTSPCYQPYANEFELAKHMLYCHPDPPSTLFAYILLNTAPALKIWEELERKADHSRGPRSKNK